MLLVSYVVPPCAALATGIGAGGGGCALGCDCSFWCFFCRRLRLRENRRTAWLTARCTSRTHSTTRVRQWLQAAKVATSTTHRDVNACDGRHGVLDVLLGHHERRLADAPNLQLAVVSHPRMFLVTTTTMRHNLSPLPTSSTVQRGWGWGCCMLLP